MRRSLVIILAIAALATSCKRVEKPVDGSVVSVLSEFDVSQPSPTKATSTAFEAGDQVGLFMVDFVGGVPSPLQTTGNQADNICFTSNSSGLLTTNPPVLYTKDLVGKTDIYAYYPYDAKMASKNVNSYEFKVQESQLGGISASDFCLAKTVDGVIPSPSPVRLEFRHQLSKIEITLNVPRNYEDGLKIKGVKNFILTSIVNGVTVNMGTQTVTNIEDSRYEQLIPFTAQQGVVSDVENVPYVYHMIAPAQEYSEGRLLISLIAELEVGQDKPFEYVVKDKLFGDNKTKAGMVHRLTFSVEPGLRLVFKGSTIEPWTEAPASGGGLESAISTEFSVSQQPFASNFGSANRVKVTVEDGTVYDILSGVSVSGGVCKFKFNKSSGFPRQYGFRITGLEFLTGNTRLYKTDLLSDCVYNPSAMNLGLLPFGGSGTVGSPYLIRNAVDLYNIRQASVLNGQYFKQTTDIDVSPYLGISYVEGSVAAGGDGSAMAFQANSARVRPYLGSTGGWDSLPSFDNYYNGGGCAIKGITINKPTLNNQALFGGVGSRGKVYNVKLKGVYIKGNNNVGGIAANNYGQIFASNVVDGVVSGDGNVGGVVGNSSGVVNNATNGATVLGRSGNYTGGVVGSASGSGYGFLVNYGSVSGKGYTGGVCGMASGLRYSYNRGSVSGGLATTSGAIVGGSINTGSVFDNCYWLSSASYVNCGAEGRGTDIATGVTNFAAMSADIMQNANKLDPNSLYYKLNRAGVDWVMALGGYYNEGWLIPNPNNYIFAYSGYGAVPASGGKVGVNIVISNGASWSATSSNTSIAAITSGASGSGSGVLDVTFTDNSSSTGGGYRSVDLVVNTGFGKHTLTLRQSNGL